MGRKAKVYDEEEILRLYEKYGSIQDIRIRLNISSDNIREILVRHGKEIVKGVHKKQQLVFGKNLYS